MPATARFDLKMDADEKNLVSRAAAVEVFTVSRGQKIAGLSARPTRTRGKRRTERCLTIPNRRPVVDLRHSASIVKIA